MATKNETKRFIFLPPTQTDDEMVKKNDNERFQHNGVTLVIKKGEKVEVPDWFFEMHPDYSRYEVK